MKQTAVEWLIDQVEDFIGLIPVDIIEQAKAMQNKKLREAWNDGYKKAQQDIVTNSFSTFEQYQNEKNG
jgi:hypothetical protein